jgi:hypothetical protein
MLHVGPSPVRVSVAWTLLLSACVSAEPMPAPVAKPPPDDAPPPHRTFAAGEARRLAAGADLSCRVTDAGTVECWGGPPRPGREPWEPEAVEGFAGVVEIAARARRACARLDSGAVWCWEAGSAPRQIGGVDDAAELALGERHGCARTTRGAARCWTDASPAATLVPDVSEAVGIAAARSATCVRTAVGELVCWGELGGHSTSAEPVAGLEQVRRIAGHDELCALGPGTAITCFDPLTLARRSRPTAASEDATLLVSAGWGCSAAGMSLSCWGAHPFVGPQRAEGLSPPYAATAVTELAAGGAHVCARAVREKGGAERTVCWGDNGSGQLGGETLDAIGRPTRVEGISDASAIASGFDHTCVLRSSGRVTCFGDPDRLVLGAPRAAGQVLVDPPGISGATALDAAGAHTCVVHDGGKVACFGLGTNGQLGAGAALAPGTEKSTYFSELIRQTFDVDHHGFDSALPYADTIGGVRAVLGVPKARRVSLSAEASCALTDQGVFCWGTSGFHRSPPADPNEEGDCLSPPRATLPRAARVLAERPVKVPGTHGASAFGLMTVDMFGRAACVVDKAGRPRCWNFSADDPKVDVEGTATGLVMKDGGACFLTQGGPRCLRFGYGGVYPDAEDGEEPTPRATVDLALGGDHRCELEASGLVYCEGASGVGALGRGLTSVDPGRAVVPGLSEVRDISATDAGMCAARVDGTVWCWGGGSEQLGQPRPSFSSVPIELR